MMTSSLDSMIATFADANDLQVSSWPRPDAESEVKRILVSTDTIDEGYVPPEVERVVPPDDAELPAVLLVAAAGAVGKSSLARYIGNRTGNMVLDISEVTLGTNVIQGRLLDLVGGRRIEEIQEMLSGGRLTLILDAVDEAILRSDANHGVRELCDDIKRLVRKPPKGVAIVLLGRISSMELVHLTLEDIGVRSALYSVSYFSPQRAVELVTTLHAVQNRNADTGTKAYVKEAATVVLEKFLTALDTDRPSQEGQGGSKTSLAGLEQWPSIAAREFLGYAPVLHTIARILSGNTAEQIKVTVDRLSVDGDQTMWSSLNELCLSILTREQGKLAAQLAMKAESLSERVTRADWEECFTPENQMNLLMDQAPEQLDIAWPAGLRTERRGDFLEAVRQFLNMHPFLRDGYYKNDREPVERFANAVFRDFTVIHFLRNASELQAQDLLRWSSSLFTSPLLGRLALAGDGHQQGVLPSIAFDLLLASLMERRSTNTGFVAIDAERSNETGSELRITLGESDAPSGFVLLPKEEQVVLRGDLRDMSFDCPEIDLVLDGRQSTDVRLSGSVSIRCRSLTFSCASVALLRSTAKTKVTIYASHSLSGQVSLPDPPEGCTLELFIHGEPPWPWGRYKVGAPPQPTRGLDRAASLFASLLRNLKKATDGVRGGHSYHLRPVEDAKGRGRFDSRIYDFAIEVGLLEKSGAVLRLHLDRFGIPFETAIVRDFRNAPGLLKFLDDFLDAYPDLRRSE